MDSLGYGLRILLCDDAACDRAESALQGNVVRVVSKMLILAPVLSDVRRIMLVSAKFKSGRAAEGDRPRGCGKGGFSLVEMMVAMLVLGLVLTAAFSTVAQALKAVEISRDYARVAQILQSEMEDLRTMNWTQLEAEQAGTTWYVPIDLTTEFNEAFGARYKAYRWIRDLHSDQKEARVKVVWQDANGNTRIKRTVAWFTKNGLHDYYYRSF